MRRRCTRVHGKPRSFSGLLPLTPAQLAYQCPYHGIFPEKSDYYLLLAFESPVHCFLNFYGTSIQNAAGVRYFNNQTRSVSWPQQRFQHGTNAHVDYATNNRFQTPSSRRESETWAPTSSSVNHRGALLRNRTLSSAGFRQVQVRGFPSENRALEECQSSTLNMNNTEHRTVVKQEKLTNDVGQGTSS